MFRTLVRVLPAAAIYFAAAAVALAFTRFGGGAATLWPASGLLAGALATLPTRRWPSMLCGCGLAIAAAIILFGQGALAGPLLAPINLLEAVSIVVGLRYLDRRLSEGGSMTRLGAFVLVAGVVVPGFSALYGASVLHVVTGHSWTGLALDWYAAHALGNLIVMPVVDGVRDLARSRRTGNRRTQLGGAALLLAMAAVTAGVFSQSTYPLLFLPLLPLVTAAFVIGVPGTAAAMLLIAVIGGTATALGTGPVRLIGETVGLRMQFFQLYLAIAGLIAFPMAAEIRRRAALVTELRRSEASYRLLADRLGDVLLRLSVDGTVEYASPSIAAIGGLKPEDVVGRPARELMVAEDREAVIAAHKAAVADPAETSVVEFRFNRPDGRLVWLEMHTRGYCGEDHKVAGVVSSIRDVTQRKATESELLWEATTDPLTELGNRRAFDRVLADAKADMDAGGRTGCVAIFDIDHFKRINDSWGHDAGDAVIRAMADTLRRSLRGGDFAARLGGEEFGLVLRGLTEVQAVRVCQRVRAAFAANPVLHAGGVICAKSASAGVCRLDRAADPDGVVRLADEALYRAKNGGRNRLELAA